MAGGAVYDNRPAIQTPLNFPNGLWLDREGGLWVADSGDQVIRRMELATSSAMIATAMMKVMVGGGTVLDDAVPVPADTVRLDRPSFLVGDSAGNIYFSDTGNNRIRRWNPDGLVTTVDPTRLRAGVYVALLTITAAGALNSPQTAIVLAHIAQRGSPPVGLVIPPGLIFTTPAGDGTALTKPMTLASTGGQPLQFLVRARTQAGGNWLSVTPEQGTLLSSSESLSLQVEARPAGLSAGVYFGSVTFGFGTGATQEVTVALVVSSGTASAGAAKPSPGLGTWNLELGTSSADCTPRRLVVLETRLGRWY